MKKTNQKLFSRFTAFTLAIASSFGVFAKAEKPPFPRGYYRIFNVAVVGSDVEGEKAKEESHGFNKNVMKNLCDVGIRLENFAEVEVLNEDKISIAGRELPRTSMLMPEENIVFCFYDMANVYTNLDVIKECPYAICPYTLNLGETYDAWTNRMTKLRDFVKSKNRNEMCDLTLLGIVQGKCDEATSSYIFRTNDIACRKLDIYDFQQTVEAFTISNNGSHNSYRPLIEVLLEWAGNRANLFEKYTGKSIPELIVNLGMQPAFLHQEGDENSIAIPPIAPKPQPVQPAATQPIAPKIPTPTQPFAPKSEASEESKKNLNKYAVVGVTAVSLAVCIGITFYLAKKYL